MKKLVIILAALAFSSVAFAAQSDDVLQNVPASKNTVVADASATGTMPQQELTPAGLEKKPVMKHHKKHPKKHHVHKHKHVHKKAMTEAPKASDAAKNSQMNTQKPSDQSMPASQ